MNLSAYLLKRDYLVLYLLLVLVYLSGLWIPLMENDSAQHAVMAMRMYLENDFVNLYKGGEDYLDKPHMHFWLLLFLLNFLGFLNLPIVYPLYCLQFWGHILVIGWPKSFTEILLLMLLLSYSCQLRQFSYPIMM